MSQSIEKIHFLAKILERVSDRRYKISVNKNNLHDFPSDSVSVKIINSSADIDVGSTIYAYDADLDTSLRELLVNKFTYIFRPKEISSEVELDDSINESIDSMDVTPYDFMKMMRGSEDSEEVEEDESEVSDTEDEE